MTAPCTCPAVPARRHCADVFHEQDARPVAQLPAARRHAARRRSLPARRRSSSPSAAACGFITNVAFDATLKEYSSPTRRPRASRRASSEFARELARGGRRALRPARQGRARDRLRQGRVPRAAVRAGRQPGHRHRPGVHPGARSTARRADRMRVDRTTSTASTTPTSSADAVVCRHTLEHIARRRRVHAARAPVDRRARRRARLLRAARRRARAARRSRSGTSTTSTARTSRPARSRGCSAARASTSSTSSLDFDDQYSCSRRARRGRRRPRVPARGGAVDELAADVERFRARRRRASSPAGASGCAPRAPTGGAWSHLGRRLEGRRVPDHARPRGRDRVAVDINPHKHGMFMAGTGHEIVAPEHLATASRTS